MLIVNIISLGVYFVDICNTFMNLAINTLTSLHSSLTVVYTQLDCVH